MINDDRELSRDILFDDKSEISPVVIPENTLINPVRETVAPKSEIQKNLRGVKACFVEGWTPFPSKAAIESGRMIPGGTMKSDVLTAEGIAAHGADVHMISCKGETDGRTPWRKEEESGELSYEHMQSPSALLDKLIATQDQYDVIHVNNPTFFTENELAKRFNAQIHKPVVLTVTGSWLFTQVTAEALQGCAKIACMSQGLVEMARNLGIAEDKIELVPNGIDTETEKPLSPDIRESIREHLLISPEAVVFSAIGRISPEKRLDILTDRWKEIYREAINKDIYLLILGKPADTDLQMKELYQQLQTMQPDHILALGWVDAASYLAATDFTISNSDREGLSNVLLEAGARERPNIGPRETPGFSDVITHGQTGYLYDLDNEASMEKVVQHAITLKQQNPDLYRNMCKAARQTIVDKYSQQAIARRYAEVYKDAIDAYKVREQINGKISSNIEISSGYKDLAISPKGGEAELLRDMYFPEILKEHIAQGGNVDTFIDIGAADGSRVDRIRQQMKHTIAIEPLARDPQALQKGYNEFFHGTWDSWHKEYPDVKGDFLLASHTLYYLDEPVKAVDEMLTHLNVDGSLHLVLEDIDTGKVKLYSDLGKIPPLGDDIFVKIPFEGTATRAIVDPDKLAGKLLQEGYAVEKKHMDVPIVFQSEEEALQKFRFLLQDESIPDEQILTYIKKTLKEQDTEQSGNELLWNRDSVILSIYKKNQKHSYSNASSLVKQERLSDIHPIKAENTAETLPAPYNYRNLAEVRASIASGSFATDIPGVKVEERIYGCPVVTIGDKRPVGNEKSSFAVDRSRVVEWAVPFDAVDQQARIGKSVFYMRKHIPTDKEEYSKFPPTPEIMQKIGAEKIYDDYAVLNAHGWVSGDKTSFTPTEGEHGSVARETYFSKSNAFLPPDVDIYSLEPVGHLARKDEKGRPFTPNEEIAYMDIDNYVAAIEEAVNQIAFEKARRDEASGKKSTMKLVLTGHSWGGRSVAQISKELIAEMHSRGIDIIGYLQEPAFRMHGGFNALVPPVVSMLRPLTTMVNEPTGDLSKKAKDGVEKVRGTLTKTVIDQLGNIMQLEPGDSMMQRAHETSMSATLETLAGLSERPLTDFRARQLCLQPWVGVVELSGKDTLVDNGGLEGINKAVLVADRGHVTQRDDIAALMQAETVVALMGIDVKKRGEDQQKLSAIRSALTA